MAFLGGDSESLKFILTPYGKQKLLEKGLTNSKLYYTLFDDEVIYTVDAYPNLLPDISGTENKISNIMIYYRYNLTK